MLTGTPTFANMCTVIAILNTDTKAVNASRGVIPEPTASITRLLYVIVPTAIASPPQNASSLSVSPNCPENMPVALATLFAPNA